MGPTICEVQGGFRERGARRERVFHGGRILHSKAKLSSHFDKVNRNKKSLALSFQHESGVDVLHKLAAESDILVENYLPGTLKKYKMDYQTLSKINPRLI